MPLAKKLTPAEKLETFDLYLELRSLSLLAEKLGINTSSAASRLKSVGIWEHPRPNTGQTIEEANGGPQRIRQLREKLVNNLKAAPGPTPVRPFGMLKDHVPPADLLATVQLYAELQSSRKVAEKLGVSLATVFNRITSLGLKMRPHASPNVSFEQANKPGAIEAVVAELNRQIAALKAPK